MEPFFDMAYTSVDFINDVIVKVQYFINGNNPPMNDIEAQKGGMSNYAIIYPEGFVALIRIMVKLFRQFL